MSKLVIVGVGETGLLAYEYFTLDSDYQVVGFAVDSEYMSDKDLFGLPVVDLAEIEEKFPPKDFEVFVAISSTKLNRVRESVYLGLKNCGYRFASYISSQAFVWHNVKVGHNCFILENNTLQPYVEIGNNVVLWSGNHVGHRTLIQDHCFIASHCVISGFCNIGQSTFLGVNSTIENDVSIGASNFIGAGALIRKSTKDNQVFQAQQTEPSKIQATRLFRIKE